MNTDQGWDTFAVIVGGAGGALVGLLFVAISVHAARIAASADLQSRAAKTPAAFATLLLMSVVLAVPGQSDQVVGAELVALAVLASMLLLLLDRRAVFAGIATPLSGALNQVNPNVSTVVGLALTGGLLLGDVHWAPYVLVPTVCIAIVGGLTSAWLLRTKLTE
jgi:hypothetical protein